MSLDPHQHSKTDSKRGAKRKRSQQDRPAKKVRKETQQLMEFVAEECRRRQYRQHNGVLFLPRITDDGHYTFTYKYACEILSFIHDAIYPYHDHIGQHMALMDGYGVPSQVIDHLKKTVPKLSPADRTKSAFKNGLYDETMDRFYPYGEPTGWPASTLCGNYEHVVFKQEKE
jgi:hypothetical protein